MEKAIKNNKKESSSAEKAEKRLLTKEASKLKDDLEMDKKRLKAIEKQEAKDKKREAKEAKRLEKEKERREKA